MLDIIISILFNKGDFNKMTKLSSSLRHYLFVRRFAPFMTLLVALGTLLFLTTMTNAANRPITIIIDGTPFIAKQPVKEINGSLYVPFRDLFEALGLKVSWDAGTKQISGQSTNLMLQLKVGSRMVIVNGNAVTLSTAIDVHNGAAYVPLRFVGEHSGRVVLWEPIKRTVTITSSQSSEFHQADNIVSAKVVDPSGQPVAGARINFYDVNDEKDVKAIADRQGMARTSNLLTGATYISYAFPPEGVKLTPSNPGYRFTYDGKPFELPLFTLLNRDISGTVLMENGKPYTDANGYGFSLSLNDKKTDGLIEFNSTETDRTGAFYFGGLKVGTRYLIPTTINGDYYIKGFDFVYEGVDPKFVLVMVNDPDYIASLSVKMFNSISIKVVDQDGSPLTGLNLSNLSVDLYIDSIFVNGQILTYEDGKLTLNQLKPGITYRVNVSVSGNLSLYLAPAPFTFTYTSTMKELPEIRLIKRNAQLSGKTVQENGLPITDSSIRVYDIETNEATFTTKTAKDGTFDLTGLIEGRQYRLFSDPPMELSWPIHFGYPEHIEFTYSAGMQPLQPMVIPNVQLTGVIKLPTGIPVQITGRLLDDQGRGVMTTFSNNEGKLALWGMKEGKAYTLSYEPGLGSLPKAGQTIPLKGSWSFVYSSAMPTFELTLEVEEYGPKKLTGKVVDGMGMPVAGATVQFSYVENGEARARLVLTDSEGNYSFELFRPQSGSLFARKGGLYSQSANVAEARGNVSGPTLTLQ
jgi:protocatechuate 3,4-dioxygenase beta subunit